MWGKFASRRGEARYPGLWDGRVAAWCPSVTGPTGARLYDLQFGRYQGTLTNMDTSTDWVRSSGQYALDFDGSNDYVDCGNNAAINPTSGIAASAWVFPASSSSVQVWVIARDDATLGRAFAFGPRFNSDSKLWLQINGASTLIGNSAVAKNTWSHVAFSGRPSSGYVIYLNGIADGTASWTAPASTTGSTTIGSRTYAGSNGYFTGRIDDAAIYNRALTAGEIRTLSRRRGIAYEARRQDFGEAGFKAAWARQRTQLIGGGL